MERLTDSLRDMLPVGCGIALERIGTPQCSAFPNEEAIVAKAVLKRRLEFRAGRLLARQALAEVGCPPCQILAHKEGDPLWPRGFVGSIAHDDHTAAAIVAPSGLLAGMGLDLEADSELDRELRALVCRPDEMMQEPALRARGIDPGKLGFVAKEAYFKALFPAARVFFDFMDVRLLFDATGDRFQAQAAGSLRAAAPPSGRDVIGRFTHADGIIAAVAYFRP